MPFGVGEERDRHLRQFGHRQDCLTAELLGLVERRLRIVGADVERHVTVPVGGLADAAADAAVLLLDHRVRNVSGNLLRVPTEELAVELLELVEVFADDLEMHDGMCHCGSPLSASWLACPGSATGL